MFEPEKAMVSWRSQMIAAGIKQPARLDELECHLRETMAARMKSGMTMQDAFEAAVRQMGEPGSLNDEYRKAGLGPAILEWLMVGVAAVFIGLILFLGGATVVLCYTALGDRLMAAVAMASCVVLACGWTRLVPYLPVIANPRKRLAGGLGCIAFGFMLATIYCNVILPRFRHVHDSFLPAVGLWAAFIVAIFSCLGVGLCLAAKDRGTLRSRRRPSGHFEMTLS